MKLRDLGEFAVIARIERAARKLPAGGRVVLGIGDDAAVLRPRSGEEVVVSTDASVEGVHFRWQTESPRTVGRRALVANLSDLAAMGARPLGFTWAVAAPADLSVARLDGLIAGLLCEAGVHRCPLIGGNVTSASETVLTLTVLGTVPRGRALRRRGARAGDRVFVTGALGGGAFAVARAKRGVGLKYVATPRLAAGRALAALSGIGGCIDVSDGLEADLAHLLEHTNLVSELRTDAIPRPPGFERRCARAGIDPLPLLLRGGEDYELLFTARASGPSAADLSRRLRVPVTEIGKLRPGRKSQAAKAASGGGGFSHFRKA